LKSPIRILVAPLDWGLGHTTRCIPIIQQLLKQGAVVTVAGNAQQLQYLQTELADVHYLPLQGYNISYAKTTFGLLLMMLWQIPKIVWSIYKEHRWLKSTLQNNNFDAVISDNRYGLFSNKTTTVFITHQLHIQVPFGSKVIHYINTYFIKKYTHCWVPDDAAPNSLAGVLSANSNINFSPIYIGAISRFTNAMPCITNNTNTILCILSGPEPQRSLLAQSIALQLANTMYIITVVGYTSNTITNNASNITYLPLQSATQLQQLIATNHILVSRSGYTTVMDLAVWQRAAILVPTPGQTEQEYLGQYAQQQLWHFVAQQHNIDWLAVIQQYLQQTYVCKATTDNKHLQQSVQQLLATIH
jgi:UDP-N-acetylglucosamine transferase subunit ALG13